MPGRGAPVGEGRTEPRFDLGRAAGEPRPVPVPARRGEGNAEARREPTIASGLGPPPGPERERPVASRLRTRPFGPLGSLVLHLLPLLLLLDWPMRPPAEIVPIPVKLVMLPPPLPPPKPPPKPAAAKPVPAKPPGPPAHGRLASEDLGDTKAAERQPGDRETPKMRTAPPAAAASPKPPPQKTAAVIAPAPTKAAAPKGVPAPAPPRPKPKPTPVLHQPVRRVVARTHLVHHARYPGPAATRSQYLAYLAALTSEHFDLLPPAAIGGRRGKTVIGVLVLDDGRIARMWVDRSSGYPDIDRRVERMIRAVGRFPPLPQWFQGPGMMLDFTLPFPEALEN